MMQYQTTISISGDDFWINDRPTYAGRTWKGHRIEGLLMNSRMVQGVFDDLNPETRSRWDYPDRPWDPDYNTDQFIAHMPLWREHGLLSFNVNLQGGSPLGYSKSQPWHNSAFREDGSLRLEYLKRLQRILDRADALGMVPQVGFFYFGQDQRFNDEAAVIAATDAATDWLLGRGYTNLLVEIVNEANVAYTMEILKENRVHELIARVQERSEGRVEGSAGRLLVGASMSGNHIPPEGIVRTADFQLLHGNSVGDPNRIREMVREVRALPEYGGEPVVFNEDDHFDFDKPDNNMIAAVSEHASWGFFDYRMKEEGFEEGYQSVPTDWGINSERKRGFFNLLREMTGGGG